MVKNCPPGVLCIDNLSGFILLFIFIVVLVYLKNNNQVKKQVYRDDTYIQTHVVQPHVVQPRVVNVPVNVPTQQVLYNRHYEQIGILTNMNKEILPLFGKIASSNRSKWNYYTMNNSYNAVKLPITFKNKSCTGEYGCDELMNGDTVYVEGYNSVFEAKMYEKNTLNYIPYNI